MAEPTARWNPRIGAYSISGLSSPDTFVTFDAVEFGEEDDAWVSDGDPAFSIRFMGFDLASSIAGAVIFRAGLGGETVYQTYVKADTPKVMAFGEGILLDEDVSLTIEPPAGAIITGTIFGIEQA